MAKLIDESVFDYLNFNETVEGGAVFAVPNEIFSDFQSKYAYGKSAYAYSYYYLSMYLHLYAKYGSESSIDKFTFSALQRLLGISAGSRSMNSITKKNGDLDILGYTSTCTDYPVDLIRLERIDSHMDVTHYMYSEERRDLHDRITTHGKNFTVKHPDKMYWRTQEDKEYDNYNGTMNQADNTHMIPLEMFLHAMNNDDIMTKGFYVYAFIVYKDSIRNRRIKGKRKNKGWNISLELFSKDINISEKTLKSILNKLEKHGFITITREKKENGLNKPNIYIPNTDPQKIVC